MDLNKMALFRMAKTKLDWAAQRHSVLAGNVANADTPGYKPRDIQQLDFQRALKQANQVPRASGIQNMPQPGTLPTRPMVSPAAQLQAAQPSQTNPMHSNGTLAPAQPYRVMGDRKTYDSSIDGNKVVIEEQMLKVSSTRREYEMSMNLFRKHLTMLRTALGKGQ